MKEIATENFQRVCQAYEILTDENKRIIYDIYGMEGLTSGLELGPKLDKVNEMKEELERLRRRREREKASPNIQSSGSILANLSWPDHLDGDGIMRGYELHFFLPVSQFFDTMLSCEYFFKLYIGGILYPRYCLII